MKTKHKYRIKVSKLSRDLVRHMFDKGMQSILTEWGKNVTEKRLREYEYVEPDHWS